MEALKLENLTKFYGKTRGIDNINLTINKGEVYGFIGPNGAGKSTTIKCIMDLINKNSGNIYINEKIVNKKNYMIKEKIGYISSEIHLYDDLTVRNMLKYSSSFYKNNCIDRAKELAKRLDLDIKKKISELSLGNLKKVAIILALMHEPEILIMDEATSGLDPLMQETFFNILREEKDKGTTIFFSSHILTEVNKICDKIAIIKDGKIIKVDTPENLTTTDFVKVKIISNDTQKIKKDLKLDNIDEKDNEIKFIYKKNINELVKTLNQYELTKLVIEEPDIDEVFMQFYE